MAATSFHHFPALPLELRLKIWEFALPGPRVVEVFIKGHRIRPQIEAATDISPVKVTVQLSTRPWMATYDMNLQARASQMASANNTNVVELSADNILGVMNIEGAAESERDTDSDDDTDEKSDYMVEVDVSTLKYVSSSPVPSMLHACPESRELALKKYKLRFATQVSPAMVYFDDLEDTLYLPYWSFERGSSIFTAAVSSVEPLGVRHVALDIDKWFVHWNDDTLNDQIEPLKFPHLQEIIYLETLPDPKGYCSCCHEPERPSKLGGVGFVEPEKNSKWVQKVTQDCKRMLDQMVEHHPGFKQPVVKVMAITRNGLRI